MTCCNHHSLDTLLKAGERSYLINIAYNRKRKSREEIFQSAMNTFSPKPEKRIRKLYGVSFQEYLDKVVEIENQTFGDLESAFVPSRYGRQFVSETNLEKIKIKLEENMSTFSSPKKEWKIVYAEIKGRTTDAEKELYSKCGLTLVDCKGLTRDEWQEKLDNFVDLAKKQAFVEEIHLTGSLARDVDSSKDADVVMVVSHCPEQCEVFQKLRGANPEFGHEVMIIGRGLSYFPIDLYCFNKDEFKLAVEENYRIVQDKKLLFQR